VKGKGTKRGKGSKVGEGAFRDFRICVYVRDYYEFRACYVQDCYVRENYVAPVVSRGLECGDAIVDEF
jgi:hypothetical protein